MFTGWVACSRVYTAVGNRMGWSGLSRSRNPRASDIFHQIGQMEEERGTPALHLNEPTWIIDGFNELLVDFLFALVIFLDSTQPRPLKSSK